MRTRTYITLALLMGIAAIGTVWFGIDRVTDANEDRATAVDSDFQPADIETPRAPDDEERVELDDEAPTDPTPVVSEVDTDETNVEIIRPGQSSADKKKREKWDSAVLQIVTNFEKADVTVNGLPYPEYTPEGEEEGLVLPAGGPHIIEVTYDGKTKTYQVHLRANETRILMVELSGLRGSTGGARPQTRGNPNPKRREAKEEKEKDEKGRVTVYSKPNGTVLVDGSQTNEKTPGTVEVEPGRHDIQVKFDNGDVSEKKIIRVRKGSRIKLFFRQRD
jgi:hypothetical protein